MGNQVTAHNTINSVRTDIVTETKTLKNCFQELFANMKCKATSQANISGEIDEIVNYLKKTENNLCSAQQAATALAGVNRKVAEKTISINVFSAVSGIASMHPIDINPDGANQALGGFRGCAQKLELKIDILNRCKKEISALPESEQNISSVSTIDSIFAGLVGGIKSAVTKVKTVKQQCVSGLKNAVSNLQKAITCIRDIGSENGRYAKLIAEFAACDANIINRYKISRYSDVLMRTRQYNDGNVPAENDLQNEITNVGGTAGSIATVTCESCKELDEEAARLKYLYDNVYGTITLTPNMEGHSMKQSDYQLYDEYGNNVGCWATSVAMGLSIVNGRYYNPEEVFRGQHGGCLESYQNYNQDSFNPQAIVEKLKSGKPVLFHYGYNRGNKRNQHWVLINGIRKGADLSNLTLNDFTVLDPGYGETEKTLGSLIDSTNDPQNGTSNFTPYGYQSFR